MSTTDWQTQEFEQHRAHLHAVAYRMLGSSAEAEDAVQETWLRISGADGDAVQNLRGWLTTIISRICLDMLRARRARREQLTGDWLPAFDVAPDPSEEALTADAVGAALLIVLDTLSPPERLAFVLHDMFGMPFEEIAPIVERNPTATRQLASRARRRVRGARPPHDAENLAGQREVVNAFLRASREGDFDGLMAVLDPDVVLRTNRDATGAPRPSEYSGRELVAARVIERGARFARWAQPILVDGKPGLAVVVNGRVLSLIGFDVRGGKVREMNLFVYPPGS